MSAERIEVPGITIEELTSAIRDAGFTGESSDKGKTVNELAGAWECSPGGALQLIKKAKAYGILIVGKRTTERIDGGKCRVPVYSFAISKPAAKKAKAK